MDATPAPTPQPQSAMPPLATIGYAAATPASLIAALRAAEVELVVDVRAVPASRRPGFSKRQLAGALAEAGIGYLHLQGLGTPAAGREAARAGRLDAFERIFREHLAGLEAQADLAELARLIGAGRRLCLLCLEAEPAHCHRAILAEELRRQLGLEVRHLAPECEPAPPFTD